MFLSLTCGAFGVFSSQLWAKENETAREVSFKLLANIKRGTESYTQGLAYELDEKTGRAYLLESGGRYGRSLLRRVDAETMETVQQIKIPNEYFAEGIAAVDDKLFMLTWRERACLVYDKATFKQVDEFRYRGEGWGLAYDGQLLAMSDGTSRIRFMDPKDFRQKRSIDVHFMTPGGVRRSVPLINELEYVDGELWANVFQQKYVIRINPENGRILGAAINFANLVPPSLRTSDEYVLNGLAFDPKGRRLFVTGKCWPVMYVLRVTNDREKTFEA
ncbi:MAG: glutaminyl-peptide cyclotransferase [Thermoguttaceae bacterium]